MNYDPSLAIHDLPLPEITRIRALLGAAKWLDSQFAPTKHFAEAAEAVTREVAGLRQADGGMCHSARPVSAKTMERYYYYWKRGKTDKKGRKVSEPGTWQCFMDTRTVAANRKKARTALRTFRAYLSLLLSRHKACATSAIHDLWQQWDDGKTIPGYEGLNYRRNMARPAGWSMENLLRCMPKARALKIVREGIRAAYNDLPQLFTTRRGGWPCCEVYFDDVWLDIEATGYDESGHVQIGRPLQLGCLDAFTGKRLCWGTKIRTDKKDGHSVGLNSDEMLFLLCDFLANVGYSRRGTVLVMEHGTAHISDTLKSKLFQMTGGLLRVEEGSIQGKDQPGSIYGGRGAGNPRRKAMLEEWHGLQRNRLDHLITYTGHDRKEPEALHGIREAAKKMLKKAPTLPAEMRELLLDFTPSLADVADMLVQIVGALNNRTEHSLSDWAACGFTVLEYSADGRTNWTPFSAMLPAAREAAKAAAAADRRLMRQRNMSPQEAWDVSLTNPENELIRFTPAQIMELLFSHKMQPLPQIKGGHFRLNNKRVWHEELIYEACVVTSQGYERELPAGLKYFYVFNPMDQACYILDESSKVLGSAILSQRVPIVDSAAKARAMGRAQHRLAERLEAARVIVAQDTAEHSIIAAHNADVLAGAPSDALARIDAATLRKASRKTAAPLPRLCVEDAALPTSYDSPTFFPQQ